MNKWKSGQPTVRRWQEGRGGRPGHRRRHGERPSPRTDRAARTGEHSVEALAQMADGRHSTSAHLQVLKRRSRRDPKGGTTVHHRLAGDDVAELYTAMTRWRWGGRRCPRPVPGVHGPAAAGPATPTIRPKDVTVIDVRPRDEYPPPPSGAISIPFSELPRGSARYSQIDRSSSTAAVGSAGSRGRARRGCVIALPGRGHGSGVVELRAADDVVLDAA